MGISVERFCLTFFLCLLLTFPASQGRNILQSFAAEDATETAVTETTVDEGTSSVEEESSSTGESTGTSSTEGSAEFSTPEEDAEGAVTQTVVEETDVPEESTFEEDTTGSGSVNASAIFGSESDGVAVDSSLDAESFGGDVACDFCEVPLCNRQEKTKYKFKARHILLKTSNVGNWGTCCQLCQQLEECKVWTYNSKKKECIMLHPRNYASKTHSKFSSGTLL